MGELIPFPFRPKPRKGFGGIPMRPGFEGHPKAEHAKVPDSETKKIGKNVDSKPNEAVVESYVGEYEKYRECVADQALGLVEALRNHILAGDYTTIIANEERSPFYGEIMKKIVEALSGKAVKLLQIRENMLWGSDDEGRKAARKFLETSIQKGERVLTVDDEGGDFIGPLLNELQLSYDASSFGDMGQGGPGDEDEDGNPIEPEWPKHEAIGKTGAFKKTEEDGSVVYYGSDSFGIYATPKSGRKRPPYGTREYYSFKPLLDDDPHAKELEEARLRFVQGVVDVVITRYRKEIAVE